MPDSADASEIPIREWEEAFLPEIPIEKKRHYKKVFEELVDLNWLTGGTGHPVKELWARKDYSGLVEVLSVGSAFDRMKGRLPPALQKKIRNAIKDNDRDNGAGLIFELMAMSMFDAPHHQVEVPPDANQKGFDFSVQVKSDHIVRVSCKAVNPSFEEKSFLKSSALLARRMQPKVEAGLPLFVIASLAENAAEHNLDSQKIGHVLIQEYQNWLNQAAWRPKNYQSQHSIQDWNLTFSHLSPLIPHHFHSSYGSYTFLATSLHRTNEEGRFLRKLSDAAAGLKEFSDVGMERSNMIALKIPSSISITLARAFLEKNLPEFTHISAVFLYRTQLVPSENQSSALVCHELEIFSNPSAVVKIEEVFGGEFNFNLNGLIGITGKKIERKITLSGVEYDVSDRYVLQKGHHYYSITNNEPIEHRVFPGIQVNSVVNLSDGSLPFFYKNTLENDLTLI
jgi:hypothetical protein